MAQWIQYLPLASIDSAYMWSKYIYASKTSMHIKLKKIKLINWNSPNSKTSDIAKTLLIKCRNFTGRKSGHGNFGV